jgi:signal transduction histidine kinase
VAAMALTRSLAGRLTTPADLLLAAALSAGAVVETVANGGDRAGLRTLLAVATTAALALRRRAPAVSALLVATWLAVESLATESPDEAAVILAVVVSAFSVGAYAAVREALTGLALLGMSIAISISVDPSDSLSNIAPTLLLFIVVPGALGLAFGRRGRDLAALELRTVAAEDEASAAVENERRRIARELHDVVSHAVTLIAVQAEAGQALLDRDPEAARRSLDAIGTASRDALAELHALLELLQDPAGDGPGREDSGLAHVATLVAGAREAGARVELTESGEVAALSPEADHCAYRVVQEGITNALRHTRSPRVHVAIDHGRTSVRVSVHSRGRPHQSAYGGSGRGLAGLRERVSRLGGTLDTAADGDAFTLCATLPVVAVRA